jgi:hypothetical protein
MTVQQTYAARPRWWAFAAICVMAALLAGGYAFRAVRRVPSAAGDAEAPRLATPPSRPLLMVQSTRSDDSFRKLMLAPLSSPDGAAYETPLSCDRVYFAGARGVCLAVEGELLKRNVAYVFDDTFTKLHKVRLTGLPSRARLSPDGRLAAITVFEHGHSYAEDGFSTRTTIVDTAKGSVLTDLEQFAIVRAGVRFKAADFNFWGVTFMSDSNRFFVTLASGGTKYLVEARVDSREGTVLRTGVECPSLSPDNSRLAYKEMIRKDGAWRLRIYDLRTGRDEPLTKEERSVDDQVDWLDNDRVLYHLGGSRGSDIWALHVDNSQPPSILRRYAYSPAVVR